MSKKYTSFYFFKRIAMILGISISIGVLYYSSWHSPIVCVIDGVQDYYAATDKQQIIDLFNADHYWLTVNDDHDVAHMLDTNSPNKYESRFFGKMPIKVIREDGVVAAWCTYYMRSMYEGKILFMDVHKDYRKKGYARRLAQFAECDLARQGAYKVSLATRISNKAAQVAYERMGYKITNYSDGFVHYEKKLR